MADTIPFLRWHRYQDHDGLWVEIQVRADVAGVLEATEAKLKERTCTDLGLNPNTVVDGHLPDGKFVGFSWEGPRLQFTHIIGESRIWSGPPERFEFCGGADLNPGQLCLCCDRSGKDASIPRITRADTERRKAKERKEEEAKPKAYVRGELKGGLG